MQQNCLIKQIFVSVLFTPSLLLIYFPYDHHLIIQLKKPIKTTFFIKKFNI